jgi:hypothetical protein
MQYAITDEQGLLAKIRYNRLIDIFTGLVCYSLQSHMRTSVKGIGQIETDEIYVGIDQRGAHYVIPVEAKGRTESVGIVQIEQGFAVCEAKFPEAICIPVAAQLMRDNAIALFAFEETERGLAVSLERQYLLVSPDELTAEELATYRTRPL